MPVQFQTWEYQRALDAVAVDAKELEKLRIRRKFYDGDHWQDGLGWIGPWPNPAEGASTQEAAGIAQLQQEIRRGFTPRNAVKEVISRHVGGVVGIEPRWTFTSDGVQVLSMPRLSLTPRAPRRPAPTAPAPATQTAPPTPTPDEIARREATAAADTARQSRVDRVNALVTAWWDNRGMAQVMLKIARVLLYAETATVRLYIPPRALEDEKQADGTATGRKLLRITSIEDAFSKIHVDVFDPESGRVVVDDATLAEVGIKPYKRGGTKSDPTTERTVIELTYLDEQNRTVLETIDGGTRNSITVDLGGNLLMFSVSREQFLTDEALAAQRACNFANSMIPRNVATGGFLEEIVINAKVPGHWEEKDGRRQYVPDPIVRGAGALNVWQGHELEDSQGNKTMTSPAVLWHDPVDPAPTIKAKREHYGDVLEECQQAHALITGDATASGVSRQQARADFLSSLGHTKSAIERVGRWLIVTVARFADALSTAELRSTITDGLRPVFVCFLDGGPLDAAEREQNRSDVEAGLLSTTSGIERLGIADPDAEIERIEADAEAITNLDLELKRAQVYQAWITAGIGETEAAHRAGLSPEEAARLTTSPQDTPPVQQ